MSKVIIPAEPFPIPTSKLFEEIRNSTEIAVRKMQFGDILCIKIQAGDQRAASEIIASYIYNNLPRWSTEFQKIQ